MIPRTVLKRAGVVISTSLFVLIAGACQTDKSGPPETSASTQPTFPYPPFKIRSDVAVPLQPRLADAARFALQMTVDDRLSNDPDKEELYQRYRSRIAPEIDDPGIRVPDIYVGQTGGALHRAVAARELPNDGVEVSICLYDTPGLYAIKKDGTLVKPPGGNDGLWRPQVKWTQQPAADGSTPAGPRWLLTDSGILLDITQEQIGVVCDPFKPDPFIQSPPDPTAATPTPTTMR
ncbi:hypothetical protein A5792_05555 [Mycolicibacterium peregrinum]|uniref:Lipoprotein n=1 Tax=Mycolicibacterium peregrinum TaxID=43304 RepID=A0A1A0QLZ7_MYCPR|nr:hypothetical protein [Mycolicibacterium peregrinum]OBB22529.1 hypothetical protein A5792_05555 [Mycolicibacterium peregrinum]